MSVRLLVLVFVHGFVGMFVRVLVFEDSVVFLFELEHSRVVFMLVATSLAIVCGVFFRLFVD